MNAFTSVIPEAYGFHSLDRVVPTPGETHRVPVFHGSVLAGFLDGCDGSAVAPAISNHPAFVADEWIDAQIVTSLQMDPRLAAEAVGISVDGGVVRLSGEIGSLHGSLAVRRIAASTPGVTAVVDDLWIDCE